MVANLKGEWLRRRRKRLRQEPRPVAQQPEATAPWKVPTQPDRTGGFTPHRQSHPTLQTDLLQQHDTGTGDWYTRDALCRKLGMDQETLYIWVLTGDVIFTRVGDRLLYQWVHDDAIISVGTHPGDTHEMAARRPPQLDHVGALAGLVDELSDKVSVTEREQRIAKRERERATTRLRETTGEFVALSRKHEETTRQSNAYATSYLQNRRALYASNAELRQLREDLGCMREEVARLSKSVLAKPIRRQLRALIDDE
jgi:hypothetical protein